MLTQRTRLDHLQLIAATGEVIVHTVDEIVDTDDAGAEKVLSEQHHRDVLYPDDSATAATLAAHLETLDELRAAAAVRETARKDAERFAGEERAKNAAKVLAESQAKAAEDAANAEALRKLRASQAAGA